MNISSEMKKELQVYGYTPEELSQLGWEIFMNTFHQVAKEAPEGSIQKLLQNKLEIEAQNIILMLQKEEK